MALLRDAMGEEAEREHLARFKYALCDPHIPSESNPLFAPFAEVIRGASDGKQSLSQLTKLELGVAGAETVFASPEESEGSAGGVAFVGRESDGLVEEDVLRKCLYAVHELLTGCLSEAQGEDVIFVEFRIQLRGEEHCRNSIVVFELLQLQGDLREGVHVQSIAVGEVTELDHPASRVDDGVDSGHGGGGPSSRS